MFNQALHLEVLISDNGLNLRVTKRANTDRTDYAAQQAKSHLWSGRPSYNNHSGNYRTQIKTEVKISLDFVTQAAIWKAWVSIWCGICGYELRELIPADTNTTKYAG